MLRSIMLIHPFYRLGLSLHIGQHGYVADGPHDQERAQLRLLVHQQLFFHRHTMCSSSEVGWRELCIGNVLLIPLQHNHQLRGRLSTQHVVDSAHVAYKNRYIGVQYVPLYLVTISSSILVSIVHIFNRLYSFLSVKLCLTWTSLNILSNFFKHGHANYPFDV